MGYYTHYELEVHEGNLSINEILTSDEASGFAGLDYAIDENGETQESVKWYDHEADMHFLSKEFPDIVFKLTGEGEEAGDIWRKYFKNGRMQECRAVITFESYDERKLR